ncbi:MAG: VanW family protein [Armatimonadetes bacterium]|nr:VanW family protein [Armatimonadota bacterium]
MNVRKTAVLFLLLGLATMVRAADSAPAPAPAPAPGKATPPKPSEAPDPTKPATPPSSTPTTPPPTTPPTTPPAPPALSPDTKLGTVKVSDVDVSGLTVAAARDKLVNDLLPKLDVEVTLTDSVKSVVRTRQDLSVELDLDAMLLAATKGDAWVPLRLKVKQPELTAYLVTLKPEFSFGGRNAGIIDDGETVRVDPGEMKRELDAAATAAKVAAALAKDAATMRVQVVVTKTPQTVPATTFAGITGRLARYTTNLNPGEVDRTHNVKLASSAIDGVLIPAGITFSMNEAVGERTAARGFRVAHIFENGKIVEGLGGGVSQVTGTLFNAALFAGLEIVTYRTHSRPVRYLPIGRDATVAWGQFDMKFRNNSGAPVFVRYSLYGKELTCTLYGKTVPGRKISLQVEKTVISDTKIDAKLYRLVTRGDTTNKEHIGNSHYDWKTDDAE